MAFFAFKHGHGIRYVEGEGTVSNYDSRFWELSFAPDKLDKFPRENALWHETEEDKLLRYANEERRRIAISIIMDIIENELTDMQKNCIKLHFLGQRTHAEVALMLGISRRVVTQHIYGIRRHGKQVGGGIKRIKKVCEKRGISLDNINASQLIETHYDRK